MDRNAYRTWAHRAVDWVADYMVGLADRPVRPPATPGETLAQLPVSPPEQPEDFAAIFADFERIVPDAMTHWQHPRFFAYFPANAAPASHDRRPAGRPRWRPSACCGRPRRRRPRWKSA